MMHSALTIKTRRLRLRPHLADDFDAYAEFFASDRADHMDQLNRRHAWYSFASDIAHWALFGHGAWALELPETNTFIGQVALLKPDHFPEVELGWFVLEEFEGHGYAHEAALAARRFAFEKLRLESVVSYIDPANARSIALAQRLEAQIDPDASRDDPDDLVYRHTAKEALQ